MMAKGLKDTLEFIIGPQKSLLAITAYIDSDYSINQEIEQLFSDLAPDDELIVTVDLLGGSVSNAFSEQIGKDNFYLISGVNLPLLLELCLSGEQDTKKLIQKAMNSGNEGIVLVNELLEKTEEDDF
ncbi:PTS fructose transporter subunit IIA [Enterococcus faecium]|nr:PTS fructose transporter subunit IIA [Enterococcus faecium]MCC9081422.1 PTS fructose transporter subunit IIA [Enterococcus faecium]MCC9085564.1 PTS fructose transporter subunit IIA [Enterococcus faecium]MCX3949911.1 PTS fructose transporter subunit IIA [Enterococcus faecium]MDV4549076.1 PTS fructose transporter subunit IIA [Enterococcus faecium]